MTDFSGVKKRGETIATSEVGEGYGRSTAAWLFHCVCGLIIGPYCQEGETKDTHHGSNLIKKKKSPCIMLALSKLVPTNGYFHYWFS